MSIHNFAQVPNVSVERSVMDRTTHLKTTFNESKLIPILVDEILPGDTMSLRETIFARLLTLISPIMDNMYIQTFYFWVPMRILWKHTREFFGEQRSYAALTAQLTYSIPQIMTGNNGTTAVQSGDLADYFGLPIGFQTGTGNTIQKCNALIFRAYNKIWNRFFRDQNLQNPALEVDDDGTDAMVSYPILPVNKFHDYFTSCLPWPQKGDAVQVPMGEYAPVVGNGTVLGLDDGNDVKGLSRAMPTGSNANIGELASGLVGTVIGTVGTEWAVGSGGEYKGLGVSTDAAESGLIADLRMAVAATVNDLRLSIALQRMMEKDSRFGTRYKEYLKGHFGVDYNDQGYEPVYLGGSRQRISINSVTKTFEDTGTNQVGELRATGTIAAHNHGFTQSFTEHGYIMGLCCVRGDLTYSQGTRKMWQRYLKEDIYDPCLAHIGEQPVLNNEIYTYNTSEDSEVFGYQEPWAEYRYFPALLTGLMRPGAPLGLTTWSLSEYFNSRPELDNGFITDKTPVVRVLAITNQDHVKADFRFDIKHARPMPLYSIPGFMDHF